MTNNQNIYFDLHMLNTNLIEFEIDKKATKKENNKAINAPEDYVDSEEVFK